MSRMEYSCLRPTHAISLLCAILFCVGLLLATAPGNCRADGGRTVTVPEQEPLNDHCPGQPVTNNTIIDPASVGSSSDWDYYTFTTTAGTPITLGTEDPGGCPYNDTIVDLWGACNNLIITDSDSGPLWFSLIYRYPAPFTGTYSMRVRGGLSEWRRYRAFIFLGEPPTGACCVPTGECRLENRVTCRQANGIFYGEDTPCNAVTCPLPVTNETCDGAIAIAAPGSGTLSGHLGYARNDYDTWYPSCTGLDTDGKDVVYKVDLEPGDRMDVTFTEHENNASIYLITDCGDPVASCVAGADAAGYQGTETMTYVAGTPPPGACCSDYGCQMMSEADCIASGGGFRGIWTDCDPDDCYMMQGACCFVNGACIDNVRPWNCELMGGAYAGDGTRCYWGVCPQPTGACCMTGGCSLYSIQDCAYRHGIYLGDDTPCDPNPCAGLGACCYPDHSCRTVTQAACGNGGGVYQGDGVSCVDVPCGGAIGGCCLLSGACISVTPQECEAIEGLFVGTGVPCTPNPCPAKRALDPPSVAGNTDAGSRAGTSGSRATTYYLILDTSVPETGSPWDLSYVITRPGADAPEPPARDSGAAITGAPNPFRESTTVVYRAHPGTTVRIEIFDAGGRRVRSLDANRSAAANGIGRIAWDGRDDAGARVPAGVYFAKLTAGTFTSSRTIIRID
jgi:hypothetical protein